jgi:drug/metabolite transporter (DMT)-like permease
MSTPLIPYKINRRWISPVLVGFAAFLWATDALIRYPAIQQADPTIMVFIEHILAVLILFPWLFLKSGKALFDLSPSEWAAAIFSGVGGSAIATVYFTASFLYINPSVAVLLQKLQPVIVVILAYLFLGERPERKFFFWGAIALIAGIILSFPDLNFSFLNHGVNVHSKGIQYAFAAAFLWAAATVSGKILLKRTPPTLATFWRFFFGLIALSAILLLSKSQPNFDLFKSDSAILAVLYLSLVPGLLAMLVYYNGLSGTSASLATLIELIYPIGAVVLNTVFLQTELIPIQTAAGLILICAVAMISF